jgi:DMSO/TMAO reductase YedYZ molybdopterin-dependent catalytic subunit
MSAERRNPLLAAPSVFSNDRRMRKKLLAGRKGPEGYDSNRFMKSLDLNDPVLEECIVAYSMNGEPLPMLNGFPVRG